MTGDPCRNEAGAFSAGFSEEAGLHLDPAQPNPFAQALELKARVSRGQHPGMLCRRDTHPAQQHSTTIWAGAELAFADHGAFRFGEDAAPCAIAWPKGGVRSKPSAPAISPMPPAVEGTPVSSLRAANFMGNVGPKTAKSINVNTLGREKLSGPLALMGRPSLRPVLAQGHRPPGSPFRAPLGRPAIEEIIETVYDDPVGYSSAAKTASRAWIRRWPVPSVRAIKASG